MSSIIHFGISHLFSIIEYQLMLPRYHVLYLLLLFYCDNSICVKSNFYAAKLHSCTGYSINQNIVIHTIIIIKQYLICYESPKWLCPCGQSKSKKQCLRSENIYQVRVRKAKSATADKRRWHVEAEAARCIKDLGVPERFLSYLEREKGATGENKNLWV